MEVFLFRLYIVKGIGGKINRFFRRGGELIYNSWDVGGVFCGLY